MDLPTLLQSGVSFLRQTAAGDSVDKWLHRASRVVESMTSPDPVWPIPMRAIGAQNLLTMPGGVSTAGYLHKKGGSQFSLMKWPLRFIIIHKGCVYYFKSSTSAAPQGAFSLNGYNRVMRAAEETTSSNVFPFKIVHFSKKHRTWLFSAASEEERRSWMKHLRKEIDHYNDRQESHTPSDSDSDTDSFYGSIEKPMDIRHPVDNPDDDYMEEDDDEDDEDYLKPDNSPTVTGRPTGPPPSYPPPPVPVLSNKTLLNSKAPPPPPPIHRIPTSPHPKIQPPSDVPPAPLPKGPASPSIPAHRGLPPPSIPAHKGPIPPTIPAHKGLHPPTIPAHKGLPPQTVPFPKGPPPTVPLSPFQKGLPPDRSFTSSHLHRHDSFSPVSPPLPPPNPRWTVPRPAPGESRERPLQSPATLSVCEQLESRLRLNRPGQSNAHNYTHNHSPTHNLSQSPARSPTHTLSQSPARSPTHTFSQSPARSPTHTLSHNAAHSSSLGKGQPPARPGPAQTSLKPKPPPPTCKPPMPASMKPASNCPLGRASPEGQSFRSSADEVPADLRSRWNSVKQDEDCSDSDDYENVQLPDSVYIDSTETSFVEKLFRESGDCADGLYAIRNSGTKTSKVLVVWDISVNRARNYRLFEENGCIYVDRDLTFPSLAILIEHYYSHPLPQHGSLCLQRPYIKNL